MEVIDNIKVTRMGDSLYARIPANLARVLGVTKGTALQVSKEGMRIIYERKSE